MPGKDIWLSAAVKYSYPSYLMDIPLSATWGRARKRHISDRVDKEVDEAGT